MRASEGQSPASKSRAQAGEGWVWGKVPAADEAMIRILSAFRKNHDTKGPSQLNGHVEYGHITANYHVVPAIHVLTYCTSLQISSTKKDSNI